MSIKLMSQVWDIQDMTPVQKLVFLALADQANDQGECWPSIRHIAYKCCLSERAVQYAIRYFEGIYLLKMETRKRTNNSQSTNLYVFDLELLGRTICTPSVHHMHPPGARGAPPNTEPSYEPSIINEYINNKDVKIVKKSNTKIEPLVLPEWLPQNDWNDFVQYREEAKKPLKSTMSIKRTINKLEKLKNAGYDIREIIDQTIVNGWSGLHPVNKNNNGSYHGKKESVAELNWRLNTEPFRQEDGTLSFNTPSLCEITSDVWSQVDK
jgi:hypothetical protein